MGPGYLALFALVLSSMAPAYSAEQAESVPLYQKLSLLSSPSKEKRRWGEDYEEAVAELRQEIENTIPVFSRQGLAITPLSSRLIVRDASAGGRPSVTPRLFTDLPLDIELQTRTRLSGRGVEEIGTGLRKDMGHWVFRLGYALRGRDHPLEEQQIRAEIKYQ